jgi:hypothetical protein
MKALGISRGGQYGQYRACTVPYEQHQQVVVEIFIMRGNYYYAAQHDGIRGRGFTPTKHRPNMR